MERDQEGQVKRIHSIFEEQGKGVSFTAVRPTLHSGFIAPEAKLALFTDHAYLSAFILTNWKSDRIT